MILLNSSTYPTSTNWLLKSFGANPIIPKGAKLKRQSVHCRRYAAALEPKGHNFLQSIVPLELHNTGIKALQELQLIINTTLKLLWRLLNE